MVPPVRPLIVAERPVAPPLKRIRPFVRRADLVLLLGPLRLTRPVRANARPLDLVRRVPDLEALAHDVPLVAAAVTSDRLVPAEGDAEAARDPAVGAAAEADVGADRRADGLAAVDAAGSVRAGLAAADLDLLVDGVGAAVADEVDLCM